MSLSSQPSSNSGTTRSGLDRWLEETISSYDRTATEYAMRFADVDLADHRRTFIAALPRRDGLVLDAGCGAGRDLEMLLVDGVRPVGVDLSTGLLREAARRTLVPLVHADLRRLPFSDASFDGIWSCASLLHLTVPEAARALEEFHRVLRPQGVLFVSVRHGSGEGWRPDGHGGRRWFHLYSQTDFEEAMRLARFDVVSAAVEPGVVNGEWVNLHGLRRGSG
jgi:SAM-dependent methyltransferase